METTREEYLSRKETIELAKAIALFDGVETSEFANGIYEKWARGELSIEEGQNMIVEYHAQIARSKQIDG